MSYKYVDIRPNPVTGIGSYQRGFTIKDFVDLPQVEHRRIGGPYKAKFRIYADDRNMAEDLLFLGAGREVKIYNDKGIVDFGGMIYTVTLSTGGSKVRSSLLEMSDRVWARWQEAGTANPPDRSTVYDNTASQSLYGIKEDVWNAGQQVSIAEASQYAEKQLQEYAWPTPRAIEISPGKKLADRPILEITCFGWWHTLSHIRYNQTAIAGGADASTVVENIVGTFAITAPSSLKNDLISWWTLDEVSTGVAPVVRADSHGANDLTDNGTVASIAGRINLAGDFVPAQNTFLSVADNPSLSFVDEDFTLSCWVYLDAKPGDMWFINKWDNAGGRRAYGIVYNNGVGRYQFFVSSNGVLNTSTTANTFGVPGLAAWHHILAWHDSVANTLSIQVNGGGIDAVAYALGCNDNITTLALGANAAGPVDVVDGRIDETAIWRRVLLVGERASLYNSGNGIGYDDIGVLSRTGGVGQFIRDTEIQTNITQIEQTIDADMGADSIIKSICDMGDVGLKNWVAGVDHTRLFYYRPGARRE